jgi:uncharacterized protein
MTIWAIGEPVGASRIGAGFALSALAFSAFVAAPAAADEPPSTDGLLISEYVEGSSNNKALEIYNGTGEPVDISRYAIDVYFNGNTSAQRFALTGGDVEHGDVYVFAHSSASGDILTAADQTTGSGLWNGDDAIAVVEVATGSTVDSLGQEGVDPGSAWSSGGVSTANQTLRRVELTRDTDPADAYDPSEQFAGFPQDTFDDLGTFDGSGGGDPDPDPVATCDPDEVTPIHDVQGDGWQSPMQGEQVTIEGIVVGDFQERGELGGFFVQEQDDEVDDDPATSEGIYVYGFWDPVAAGDEVVVTGRVTEYYGLTELTDTDTVVCGAGSVTATALDLPATSAERESLEGMAVTGTDLTVTETYNVTRYGELLLSSGGRLWQPTEIHEPGSEEAAALATDNDLRSIVLDDGSDDQNPDPVPYVTDRTLRVGDDASVAGVLSYAYGAFRIQPTTDPVFATDNPRPADPADVGGTVQVASFNVLNYFNGPDFPTARGADTPEEFERQRTKIVEAIHGLDADVVGLMEIENDGYEADSAIADLVAGLNERAGGDVWGFVDPGTERLGTDQIANGMIYRTDRIDWIGDAAVLDSSVDERFDDDRNRPVLAATFNHRGDFVTVAVNHLKSKGSPCAGDADPEQGNCNGVRTAAAEAEADWLSSNPTGFDEADVLVIGDLNAYSREDPIDAFRDGGFTSLIGSTPSDPAYTYVFMGRSGMLDHALASTSLAPKVTGAAVWHINADEPPAYDYDLSYGRPSGLYEPNEYRSSDHDPVVVGLDLRPPGRS